MATDVLGIVPLFSKLADDERAGLTKLMHARTFPANQPVFWLGAPGDDFYVIQKGQVDVSCPDETGKDILLATMGPGHFFGEISLLDGGPRTATVRANTNVTLLSLGRDDFLRFLEENPKAAVHMLTVLGQRQRETLEKMRGIRNVNEAVAESRTPWQVTAEYIGKLTTTPWFVGGNIGVCVAWVTVNVALKLLHIEPFDPPPLFGVLALIITTEALFVSLFVLISQAQQGNRDRIRADAEYSVNVKAHHEVMQLHQKMDRLQALLAPKPLAAPVSVVPETTANTKEEDDAG